MQIIKTLIADDNRIFVEGMKTILNQSGTQQYDIIKVLYNGLDVLRSLQHTKADVLILDLNLPGMDGLEVIKFIQDKKIIIKTLVFSSYNDPKIIRTALKNGADGYILKNQPITELFAAMTTILDGNSFLGQGVSTNNGGASRANGGKKLNDAFEDRFVRKHNLTKREMEILHLITQALSNKEIAKELFISDQTVSVHRKNIMRKLGVSNTAGLLKMAYDNSLV